MLPVALEGTGAVLPAEGVFAVRPGTIRVRFGQPIAANAQAGGRQALAKQAHDAVLGIQAIDLNLLYADAEHMAWQVTGRYPNRRSGRGLIPSPGWNDDYAWDGYADDALYPFDQDPASGWLGSANQRTAPAGYGVQLSASWFYPERSERIAELASTARRQDAASMIAMQYDQQTPFARKLQQMFWDKRMAMLP